MELKLKDSCTDTMIYIPQENRNVVGKFIDVRLYPHLYKLYPSLFEEVIETKKTKKVNDIFINNSTDEGNITE